MKNLVLSADACSHLNAQLWRYYDIEADVLPQYYEYNNGICRIFYETESGITDTYVKMRVFLHRIEDLYLVGEDGELIEPTTTLEEQEVR